MNTNTQAIKDLLGKYKTILSSIILLMSSIAHTAQTQPKTLSWQDIAVAYNKTFSTQADGVVLNANADVLRATRLQAEKQITHLNNTIKTATTYVTQNSFEEKILTQALATYQTAQNQLSAILYRYHSTLTQLRTSQVAPLSIVNSALTTMAKELETLIPVQKNINTTLQSLQNEKLFSSFFDRRKDNKKNAQALLINLLKKVYWAIDVTRDWTNAELLKTKKTIALTAQQQAQSNAELAKARSTNLQAEKASRRAKQQELVAADQEKALLNAQLNTYKQDSNSTLAGASKLISQYKEAAKNNPGEEALYLDYAAEVVVIEKAKFAADLQKYKNGAITLQQFRSRWTPSLEGQHPRAQDYLKQIEKAFYLKAGVSPEHIDMDMN